MSDVATTRNRTDNRPTEGGQLIAQILLWAGPLTVFAMALFMAR